MNDNIFGMKHQLVDEWKRYWTLKIELADRTHQAIEVLRTISRIEEQIKNELEKVSEIE